LLHRRSAPFRQGRSRIIASAPTPWTAASAGFPPSRSIADRLPRAGPPAVRQATRAKILSHVRPVSVPGALGRPRSGDRGAVRRRELANGAANRPKPKGAEHPDVCAVSSADSWQMPGREQTVSSPPSFFDSRGDRRRRGSSAGPHHLGRRAVQRDRRERSAVRAADESSPRHDGVRPRRSDAGRHATAADLRSGGPYCACGSNGEGSEPHNGDGRARGRSSIVDEALDCGRLAWQDRTEALAPG
jgi:hypothetical protein